MSKIVQGSFGMVATRAVLDPELSDRSVRVLALLCTHALANRNRMVDPEIRQHYLAEELGISQQTVADHIAILVKRGYVKKERVGFPARNVLRVLLDQPDIPEAREPRTRRASHRASTQFTETAPVTATESPVTEPEPVTVTEPEPVTVTEPEPVTVLNRDSERDSEYISECARESPHTTQQRGGEAERKPRSALALYAVNARLVRESLQPPSPPPVNDFVASAEWARTRKGQAWMRAHGFKLDTWRTSSQLTAYREYQREQDASNATG